MTNEQIQALAREYAEEMIKGKSSEELSNCLKHSMLEMNTKYVAEIFQWLTRRFCLVEKSRLKKLDIAYRAKAYDIVVLNKRDVDYIFPEIAKEVEG